MRYFFAQVLAALFFVALASAQTRTWTGAAGDGSWFTPGNWSPSGVPAAGETAIINSGTVAANSAVAVGNLTLNGGTLTGSGNVTVSGTFNWAGGTMSGSGKTTVSGTFTGPTGSVNAWLFRNLEIAGSGTLSGGQIHLNNATLSILAGASFTVSGQYTYFVYNGGTNAVVNAGTLTKIGSASGTIGVPFTNTGTFNVSQGTLWMSSGSSNLNPSTATLTGGIWKVGTGASLMFGTVRTVAANAIVELSGTDATFSNLSTLNNVAGELRLLAGASLATTPQGGTLTNSGVVRVDAGSLLAVAGVYNQTAGAYSRYELGGLSSSQFGRITASTSATVAGGVSASFLAPYVPVQGNIFVVVSAPVVNGMFSQACVDQLSGNLGVVPQLATGALNLVVSPSGTAQPTITVQPPNTTGCPVGVTVGVVASGNVLTYAWKKEIAPGVFAPVNDGVSSSGSIISGATSATLTIQYARAADDGIYRVDLSNACGSVTSAVASISVCIADLACDGQVDDADFVVFSRGYDVMDCGDALMLPGCIADLNRDGVVDDLDFVMFAQAYNELLCL